jgi:hypothetical protein
MISEITYDGGKYGFQALSHVEYQPMEPSGIKRIYKKGDRIHYRGLFGTEKVSKDKVYEEDGYTVYNSELERICPYTIKQLFEIGHIDWDTHIIIDGEIYLKPYIVVYFLNGDKLISHFNTDEEAQEKYYETLKSMETNE